MFLELAKELEMQKSCAELVTKRLAESLTCLAVNKFHVDFVPDHEQWTTYMLVLLSKYFVRRVPCSQASCRDPYSSIGLVWLRPCLLTLACPSQGKCEMLANELESPSS